MDFVDVNKSCDYDVISRWQIPHFIDFHQYTYFPSLKVATFPDNYLFDNVQNHVTLTPSLFEKLAKLINFG